MLLCSLIGTLKKLKTRTSSNQWIIFFIHFKIFNTYVIIIGREEFEPFVSNSLFYIFIQIIQTNIILCECSFRQKSRQSSSLRTLQLVLRRWLAKTGAIQPTTRQWLVKLYSEEKRWHHHGWRWLAKINRLQVTSQCVVATCTADFLVVQYMYLQFYWNT